MTRRIVDYLSIDMLILPEYRQPWPLGNAFYVITNPKMAF
jgi:hypothetical protein